MKTLTYLSLAVLFSVSTAQAGSKAFQQVGVGARYHGGQDTVVAAPFDDDISYGLMYEYHEGGTYWQLGLNYADSMGTNDVDYVLTPEINLMLTDGAWRGGVGVLSTYVNGELDSEWSDIYFQAILGFAIPLGSMELNVLTYYTFDDLDGLSEFDFDELEVGAWLMYKF